MFYLKSSVVYEGIEITPADADLALSWGYSSVDALPSAVVLIREIDTLKIVAALAPEDVSSTYELVPEPE